MRYQQYPEIKELYVLHRYYVGASQGDECYIEDIIASSDSKEELQQIADEMFPPDTRKGWNWYEGIIVVNTSTEVGNKLYKGQKVEWKLQWEQIDNNPELYKGYTIIGNREDEDSGPIAIKMEYNSLLDSTPATGSKLTGYQYIVWDISGEDQSL